MGVDRRAAGVWPVLALCTACGLGGGGITPIRTAFNRGVYQFSRGQWDEAIAEYRDALAENADDHRARFNLAVALEAKADAAGDPEVAEAARARAEQHYRVLLARKPGDLRASINLAAREHARGDADAAHARLRAAIDAHPDVELARVALGALLLRDGRLEQARATLEAAVAAHPASFDGNFMLGEVRARTGDLDGARAAYGAALRRDDEAPGALLAMAELELAAGRPLEARTWLDRLLLIDPDHGPGHLSAAAVAERLGELEEAAYHLWRARDLGAAPEADALRARLARLYERLLERVRLR